MPKSLTTWTLAGVIAPWRAGLRQRPEYGSAGYAGVPASPSRLDSTMIRFLYSLFQRPRLSNLHFVLYTRQGCHLCEDAGQLLQKEQKRYHFQLEVVDVDIQEKLVEQFGDQVPVVTVNGQIRFRGGINPVLLDRLLQAEIRHGNG